MNENEILAEVKKATDMWLDKTYNESELYSHMLSIVKNNSEDALIHREQLERLLYKLEHLRDNQRAYHGGDKSLLGTCKAGEQEMDKKIFYLKTVKAYNTDRFRNTKPKQNSFF